MFNLNVLLAVGRSDLFFRLGVIKKVLVIISIFVTYRWGIDAMVAGMVVNDFLSYFVNSFYTKRLIGYSIPEQLRDLFPYLAVSALMGLVVFAVNLPLPAGHIGQVILKVAVGATLYLGVCRGLRLAAFHEVKSLVCDRFLVPV